MSGNRGRTVQISRRNAAFQEFEALKRNRTKRTRSGKIIVEGVAPINLLAEADWDVEAVIRSSASALSPWAESFIERNAPETVFELTPQLMEEISDREDPSEIMVIAEKRVRSLDSFEIPAEGMILIADRPNSPGNLGSLIRSAYAFGCGGVIVSGHGADPFDPKAIRASLGAVFGIPVLETGSNTDLSDWVETTRTVLPLRLIGTSAKAVIRVDQVDLRGPLILVAGNETHGMSDFLTGLVDESVRIPMTGSVTSLNLACALTTVFYEVARQQEFRYASDSPQASPTNTANTDTTDT
jgi:23S rRNA (uridine2479-2'-O)-methyltransferase